MLTRQISSWITGITMLSFFTLICATSPAYSDSSWEQRGDLVLSPTAAIAALDRLPPDQPAPVSWHDGGGRTGWFGKSWEDVDGNGCDTRNEILGRDLTDKDYSRQAGIQSLAEGNEAGVRSCPNATVWSGTLHDPYTGKTVNFVRGQDTSDAVQIDHVIPLSYLYAHGAWEWDARTRLLVANDPLNLLAVDGTANQKKGACGPATCPSGSSERDTWNPVGSDGWLPENSEFTCAYAQRFTTVAAQYQLGLPVADSNMLRSILQDCSQGGDGTPTILSHTQNTVAELFREPVSASTAALGLLLLGMGILARGKRARRRRRK